MFLSRALQTKTHPLLGCQSCLTLPSFRGDRVRDSRLALPPQGHRVVLNRDRGECIQNEAGHQMIICTNWFSSLWRSSCILSSEILLPEKKILIADGLKCPRIRICQVYEDKMLLRLHFLEENWLFFWQICAIRNYVTFFLATKRLKLVVMPL